MALLDKKQQALYLAQCESTLMRGLTVTRFAQWVNNFLITHELPPML